MTSSLGAINDAKRITSSLRNARMQIEGNVLQMGDAKDQVDEDGEFIQDTNDEHRIKLKDALKRTSTNMGKLKLSEIQEKYGVMLAFGFLSLAALFIILRRLRVIAFFYFLFGYIVQKKTGDFKEPVMTKTYIDDEAKAIADLDHLENPPPVVASFFPSQEELDVEKEHDDDVVEIVEEEEKPSAGSTEL